MTEEVDEELAGVGKGLADGLERPVLLEFDEEKVVAKSGLGDAYRIEAKVLVEESQLAVVGVTGAVGVVTKGERRGETPHGFVGMLVIDGIDEVAWGAANGGDRGQRPRRRRRMLRLGASQGVGVAKVLRMDGVRIGTFHTPPGLHCPPV